MLCRIRRTSSRTSLDRVDNRDGFLMFAVFLRRAMRFLEATDLIKVEDILPFFPDFVVIDEFKDSICSALESCGAHIQSLKAEMEHATKSAENIKRDIEGLKKRFITIEATDVCARCEMPLLTRQFYAFPCQHSFHADCLITQVRYCPFVRAG